MQYRLIDRVQLKGETRQLMRTASVPPIFMALIYMGIQVVLDLLSSYFSVNIDIDPTSLLYGGISISSIDAFTVPGLFAGILITLVGLLLNAGFVCYCLGVRRGEKMPYSTLFEGFAFAGKIIALTLVMNLFVFLWSLLFVIPGIIAIFRYAFALFYLCEDPERGVMECLNLSKQHTKGYKWQYCVLSFSFFGWYLLAGLVCGIAALVPVIGVALNTILRLVISAFLVPYVTLTQVGFFYQATAPIDPVDPIDPPHQDTWTPEF